MAQASTPTTAVPVSAPQNTAVPTISGSAVRGTTLSSTLGTWAGIGNTYAYQWQRSSDGTTWTGISGATGMSYTLQVADEGDEVRLLVGAANPDGSATAATAPSGVVAASAPADTSPPTIGGTTQRSFTLTANPGSWTGVSNAYTYQWQRSTDGGSTWSNILGATGLSYLLGVGDEGSQLRFVVSAVNPDGTLNATSAATAVVAGAPPVATSAPTTSGTAERGMTLSSTQGVWTGIGNAYSYQWQTSPDGSTWTNISGATGTSYTLQLADEGEQIRLVVSASNPDGTVSSASMATGTVLAAPPADIVAPTLSGSAVRSSTLTTTQGAWTGLGNAFTYRWQRSADGSTWSDISGATAVSYTLTVADEGDQVRAVVTATNPDATVPATSAPTATVQASPPANTATPALSGTAERSFTLSTTPGAWSGAGNSLVYQWQRSTDGGGTWTSIPGATSATYTLGTTDEGSELRASVTAANPDGSASAVTAASAPVLAAPPVNTTAPAVTGAAQRTATLTATSGAWSGIGNTFAYQWQRSADGTTWSSIGGTGSSTYTLQSADEGDHIRVLVTATNPDGALSAASAATAIVQADPPSNAVLPTITGTARLGATLSAAVGTWNPAGSTFAYQWQHSSDGVAWSSIAGATSAVYTAVNTDVGEYMRVQVTATNPDGATTATSGASAPVIAPPNNIVAPAAPWGTLENTYTLTADPGTWDAPSTFAYTWQRCPATATTITGACKQVGTGATYVVQSGDVGSKLGVDVSATSAGGSTTVPSTLTAAITGRPLSDLTPPSISGNPQIPQTLTAVPGTWSVPLTSSTYTWLRCTNSNGTGCTQVATGGNYTLGLADTGEVIVLDQWVTSPGQSANQRSVALAVQSQPLPQPSQMPSISGTAMRTDWLTANPGSWSNNPTSTTYQWQRCDASGASCQNIAGATSSSYQLAQADEGSTVTVVVTASNTSGSAHAAAPVTAVVAAATPVNTTPPSISGAAQQGQVLVMSAGRWQASSDTTFSEQWQRCDSSGSSCQNIAGANQATYTPVAADVGSTLSVVSRALNPDGSVSASAAATAVVLPAAPRWQSLPAIGTDPGNVGDVLNISAGVWTGPSVGGDTIELMRCTSSCAAISGFSGTNYTIASADLGAILRLRETASNAGGTTVVWSSGYVGPVSSAASGSVVFAGAAVAAVRNPGGVVLATVRLAPGVAASADLGSAPGPVVRVLTVRRAAGVGGKLRLWVCPVATGPGGAPLPCTGKLRLGTSLRIKLPASITGKVRVVIVGARPPRRR